MSIELDEAEESLAILKDTYRFLVEEVGAGGGLTLETTGKWAQDVAQTREMIDMQQAYVDSLKARAAAEKGDSQ